VQKKPEIGDGHMQVIRSSTLKYIPASHENPDKPWVLKKILLGKEDVINGKVQMINWALLPVGNAFERHYHEDMQEVFIIVRGMAKITVEQETETISAGDAVVIPAGSIHTMKNSGRDNVEYVVVGISTGEGGKTIVV
jgi:mannose-1-phosphate guanylyltransferase/mannose-6-phosphate isomerase